MAQEGRGSDEKRGGGTGEEGLGRRGRDEVTLPLCHRLLPETLSSLFDES